MLVRLLRHTADLAGRLLFVLVLGFVLFRLLPGDPVGSLTRGRAATPEQMAALRQEFGLDRPLTAQFLSYLDGVLHGDLGTSFAYRRPVADLIGERLGPTLLLVGSAAALSVLIGTYTGMLAGWRPGGLLDRASTGVALLL